MSDRPAAEIGRTFLVGCPRSGTTLLQSLLFAHPDVISFPETFFFVRIIPNPPERWRRKLGVVSTKGPGSLAELDALGVASDPSPPRLPSLTVGGYARRFVRRMDSSARATGTTLWLEKTPRHARHVDAIERTVPRVRFLHIIRAGAAVAASMRDAHEQDPQVWKASEPWELVEVWRRYLRSSVDCMGRGNHAFVRYESLVDDPETVMRAVCAFLELRADDTTLEAMLLGYRASSAQVIGRALRTDGAPALADESWKAGTGERIGNRNQVKFRALFTEAEQAEITALVAEQDTTIAAIPFL